MLLGTLNQVQLLLALGLLQGLLRLGTMGLRSWVFLRVDVYCVLIIFLSGKGRFVAVNLFGLLLDRVRVLHLQAFVLLRAFRFDGW